MNAKSAIAIFAHPDDIEFVAAGTLLRLKEAGWEIHYMNVSRGNCGSVEYDSDTTARVRLEEGRNAAAILGAEFHEPIANDMEIVYTPEAMRKVTAAIRRSRASIVLTHSPQDYMEDHQNTTRLVVTGAFARAMRWNSSKVMGGYSPGRGTGTDTAPRRPMSTEGVGIRAGMAGN